MTKITSLDDPESRGQLLYRGYSERYGLIFSIDYWVGPQYPLWKHLVANFAKVPGEYFS